MEPVHLTLLELTDATCRWPFGDGTAQHPFSFCGCATRDESPYCDEHHAIAYVPPRPLAAARYIKRRAA